MANAIDVKRPHSFSERGLLFLHSHCRCELAVRGFSDPHRSPVRGGAGKDVEPRSGELVATCRPLLRHAVRIEASHLVARESHGTSVTRGGRDRTGEDARRAAEGLNRREARHDAGLVGADGPADGVEHREGGGYEGPGGGARGLESHLGADGRRSRGAAGVLRVVAAAAITELRLGLAGHGLRRRGRACDRRQNEGHDGENSRHAADPHRYSSLLGW